MSDDQEFNRYKHFKKMIIVTVAIIIVASSILVWYFYPPVKLNFVYKGMNEGQVKFILGNPGNISISVYGGSMPPINNVPSGENITIKELRYRTSDWWLDVVLVHEYDYFNLTGKHLSGGEWFVIDKLSGSTHAWY